MSLAYQNDDTTGVSRHSVLSKETCVQVSETVLACRDHWMSAGADDSIFFLGTSAFASANPSLGGGFSSYQKRSAKLNSILRRMFPGLYENIQAKLASILGGDTEYHPKLSLPGFIIWEPRPIDLVRGVPHFDSQYRFIDWFSVIGQDAPDQNVSMTLAVKLPIEGAALRTWGRLTKEELRDSVFFGLSRIMEKRLYNDIEYEPGAMVLQHDLVVHQPHFDRKFVSEDFRITMQFHGAKFGQRWLIYW